MCPLVVVVRDYIGLYSIINVPPLVVEILISNH